MQERIAPPDLRPVHRLLNKHAVPDDLVKSEVEFEGETPDIQVISHQRGGDRRPTRCSLIVGGGDDREQTPWIKSAEQHVK